MDETAPERVSGDEALDAVSGLADPVRRKLYRLVAGAAGPIDRDEAATVAGIKRSLAGYHLDRLAKDGLLSVTYARRSGRSGPGAGRPAKLYASAPTEVTVQLPARDDGFLAHLLASAIEADPSGDSRTALRAATRAAGRALTDGLEGRSLADVIELLERRGYRPTPEPDGIRLRNCPFHHLVGDHLDLVCQLNVELLGSAVAHARVPLTAELDPQPGQCCVVLRARAEAQR